METKTFLEWQRISDEIRALKEIEQSLRKELCKDLGLSDKSVSIEQDGYKIKGTPKFYHKIDEAVLSNIEGDLDEYEKNCLKYKPALDVRKFKALPEGGLLSQAIYVTPGMPTLKVERVKK